MTKLSRKRRVLKWIGAIVFSMWLASLMVGIWYGNGESLEIRFAGGVLFVQWGPIPTSNYRSFVRYGDYTDGFHLAVRNTWDVTNDLDIVFMLRPNFYRAATVAYLYIPLWPIYVPIIAVAAFMWWRDRRIPKGHCQTCGYNLTGNVSGICPECGTKLEVASNSS